MASCGIILDCALFNSASFLQQLIPTTIDYIYNSSSHPTQSQEQYYLLQIV